MKFSTFLPLLCLATATSVRGDLLVVRSDQAGLPESIGRETWAVIDRSCDSLLEAQTPDGFWASREPGMPDTIPATALGERGCPDAALLQTLEMLAEEATRPWDAARIRQTAYALLGAARTGAEPPRALIERLARARLDTLSAADCALALLALDAFGADTAALWDRLAERPVLPNPTLSSVAAAALARQARAASRARTTAPGPDVLAHVRWLAQRLSLGFTGLVPPPDPACPLTPENAFLISVLASSLPRHLLANPDNRLFPYDWRNHLANRLISLQQCDDEGRYYWEGEHTRAQNTTLAILTLRILSQAF